MAEFVAMLIFFLFFIKFVKSNFSMIDDEGSSLRCGSNQIIVFGDYDRIRKYALLRCAEILICGQFLTCTASISSTDFCDLPGMYLKGVYRNPGQKQMQRECCWYQAPKGIRKVREFCHIFTINPISITIEEYQKIQKEVQGTITRPDATTFASPIMMDKYYIGVQNFVKGIRILKNGAFELTACTPSLCAP